MYLAVKRSVYALLGDETNHSLPAKMIHLFFMAVIILNIATVNLETVDSIYRSHVERFRLFNECSIILFTVEYIGRLWVCTMNPRYSGSIRGRLKYALTPMALIDLFAILTLLIPYLLPVEFRVLRLLRLFQLLRILELARYTTTLQAFARVLLSKKEEIIMSIFLSGVLLVVSSSLVYYLEHEAQPEVFSSIPASLWWAVVTLTSVGYGDIYPVTIPGKIVGGVVALLGIGVVALPTGIIATGMIQHFSSRRHEDAADICPHCGRSRDHGRAGSA